MDSDKEESDAVLKSLIGELFMCAGQKRDNSLRISSNLKLSFGFLCIPGVGEETFSPG